MVHKNLKQNTDHLRQEAEWFTTVLETRLQLHLGLEGKPRALSKIAPPPLSDHQSIYQQFVQAFELTTEQRLVLILALLPHIHPHLIEKTLQKLGLDNKSVPELGGIKGTSHGGIIPTGETALFLLAGDNIQKRIENNFLFSPKHTFSVKNILRLEEVQPYEPESSGAITVAKEVVAMLTSGTTYLPPFNVNFPAKLISTEYEFADLVLNTTTERELEEIKLWLKHKDTLLKDWGYEKKINEGYKCLFYGAPGTGKSLTAALLGKQHKLPVYRIDLSMLISKYIGETEKNVSRVFDTARKDWILFFDEADALFGKRVNAQTANDRFANQEVSYLLMRMEEYTGLAILATNSKNNIDKAFLRRFQNIVHFPAPDKEERLKLWKQSFSSKTVWDKSVNLDALATNFSLTGASIMNITRFASIMALKNGNNVITQDFIIEGVKREMAKETTISGDSGN